MRNRQELEEDLNQAKQELFTLRTAISFTQGNLNSLRESLIAMKARISFYNQLLKIDEAAQNVEKVNL